MDKFIEFFQGKKTYILVLIYVILVLATGKEGPAETAIGGLDPAAIKEALLGLMVATAKAAWDRFASK